VKKLITVQHQVLFKMKNILLVSISLFALSISACNKVETTTEKKETFVLSDTMLSSTCTEVAKPEHLFNEFKFYGQITADNNKMIEVYPVVGGNVIKVYVELGDYVKKGQVLASIRSTEVAGFEKELQDAKSEVIVAKNNYKVAQELFEGKLNAERDVIEAKSEYDKAITQLNRIQEVYNIYHLKANAIYEVLSPISGFIIQKNINQDMQLRSDKSDNIFDIADINEVWAIANVNESDINQVKLGQTAEVKTISYPDKIFSGAVDKIFNIIDPETRAMKVRIKLSNNDYLLKPDMRASILINSNETAKMLCIPDEALIFDKSRAYVMIFKDRYTIETRKVEVFREVGNKAFIASGLKEGEKVITKNQLLIYDALND